MASAAETNQMRSQIKNVYTSAAFAKKVNLMAPDQVFAVWTRLKNQNLIK